MGIDILETILNKIGEQMMSGGKRPLIVAIEGRCAAGKTTLAGELARRLSCSVIHMDHFFLRPEQRTKERLEEPGGNVDYERFTEEVLAFIENGSGFTYRIFDCHKTAFHGEVWVEPTPVIIVEGAYCCRPEFLPYWDITVFLDVDKKEQMRRIIKRNGEQQAKQFEKRWIPMEENYFKTLSGDFHAILSCPVRGDHNTDL